MLLDKADESKQVRVKDNYWTQMRRQREGSEAVFVIRVTRMASVIAIDDEEDGGNQGRN